MRALPLLVTYESKPSVVRAMAADLGLSDAQRELAVELFRADLPPLSDKRWIPFLFGVSPKLVGAMIVRSGRYYRRFQVRKRSGGYREIVTPRRFLKTIQRWLLVHVFHHLEQHETVHGFVANRSIFTNVRPHLGNRNILVVDIQEFFPSVTYQSVARVLRDRFSFPDDVVAQVAGLCTVDGHLPQGAPTSPSIANAVFHPADVALMELADEWNATYTRYADDLAISSDEPFDEARAEEVTAIIQDAGFRVHPGKTRICGPGERQIVAGLVANSRGFPPRERRRKWRAMFHRASRHPREFSDRIARLEGIAAFVHQYKPELAAEYRTIAARVREFAEPEHEP